MPASITQNDFREAQQLLVTFPDTYKSKSGFVSVAQYPRGFEPDDYEFGMMVNNGQIVFRLFSCGDE